jgi:hypothetical protein
MGDWDPVRMASSGAPYKTFPKGIVLGSMLASE